MKHALDLEFPIDVGIDRDRVLTFTVHGDPGAVDEEAVKEGYGDLDFDVQVTRLPGDDKDFNVRLTRRCEGV